VRVPLLAAALFAAAVWPAAFALTLVSTAAILAETLPFVVAGVVAERTLGRFGRLAPYAGCGCAAGPSARSLPATALAWFALGPVPSLVRFAAAVLVDRALRRARPAAGVRCTHEAGDIAAELERLVPFALAAATGLHAASGVDLCRTGLAPQIAAGAVLGFFAPPCAIGAIAVASTLRANAPAAATAFLCVAGIADLNAFGRTRRAASSGDACAYALIAVAAAFVAYRNGAQLVRPAFAPALALCTGAAVALAIVNRTKPAQRFHIAPVLIVAGGLVAVPPPVYRATETTLVQAFPGERLTFTGRITQNQKATTLVRYAVTCCRADAAPLVVRLARKASLRDGTWATAEGTIVSAPAGLVLDVTGFTPVAPPRDPFLYR